MNQKEVTQLKSIVSTLNELILKHEKEGSKKIITRDFSKNQNFEELVEVLNGLYSEKKGEHTTASKIKEELASEMGFDYSIIFIGKALNKAFSNSVVNKAGRKGYSIKLREI